ncbi:MAG: hypothetical protein COY42_11490 [Armatimonadetes bacterium CG_4_10_14_0_8_um_filter_66_14]|nr:MAG: hypothetical protein COY42_11490 [Armatimonadetes bacterium CG_4_10_14_0_8_um_filter_66_14]
MAYVSGSILEGGQIVFCDPATGRSQRTPYGVQLPVLAWSPDSRSLAFSGGNWKALLAALEKADGPEFCAPLAIVDVETQALRDVVKEGAPFHDPLWSPDSSKLLFSLWKSMEGPPELWVIGADGTGAKKLLPAVGSALACSPKGGLVAYTGVDDAPGLWVLTVADGKRRQLLKTDVSTLCWPAKGAGLFYATSDEGNAHAWLLRARDEKHLQLTTAGEVCDLYPSPDGKQVAVVVTVVEGAGVDVRDRNELYVLTLKGEAVAE